MTDQAPVRVVPYEPTWVDKFAVEKPILEKALAAWRLGPVEHVGSTAVVGLCTKPVIDIMVGVSSWQHLSLPRACFATSGTITQNIKSIKCTGSANRLKAS